MDDFDTITTEAAPEFQGFEADETEEGFPSFRYGPNGQAMVCQSKADVPSGWVDHPSKVKGAPDPEKAEAPAKRLPRAELMQLAKDRGLAFKPQDGAGVLAKLLEDAPIAPIAAEGAEELAGLRAEYKKVKGKKPFNGWDADTLREKMGA